MAGKHSPEFLALVDSAKARIPEVSVADVMEMRARGDVMTLIDTREESEWARGHIAGAIHISKGVIERDVERTVSEKDALLVLYCGGGFRSALAADALHQMGYINAVSMDGGWRGWTAADGETSD